MRLMWSRDPNNRPSFSELLSAIKLISTSQGPGNEYSYTIERRSTGGPISPDYMLPLSRNSSNDTRIYADSPDAGMSHEPDIY